MNKRTIWLYLGLLFCTLLNTAYALSLSVPKSDAMILQQINAAFVAEGNLAKLHLDIEVSNASVSLSGNARTKEQACKAIILATSIAGVQAVDASGLTLKKGDKPSADDVTNSLVIGTFYREGLMGPLSTMPQTVTQTGTGNQTYMVAPAPINIEVSTQKGIVTLKGTVPDQATEDRANQVAQSVSGVQDVNDQLVIDRNP